MLLRIAAELEAATGGAPPEETRVLEEVEEDLPPVLVEPGPPTEWAPQGQAPHPVVGKFWAVGPWAGGLQGTGRLCKLRAMGRFLILRQH